MPRYAIVDCEYAQYNPRDRRLIEIGIVFIDEVDREFIPVDSYHTLINPGLACPGHVLKLTGISQAEIDSAPHFDQVAELIELLTRDQILVGHNIREDIQTLVKEFDILGVDYRRKSLCTLDLAKTSFPDLPSYDLSALCQWFHIPLKKHHRAYEDALATAQLFLTIYSPQSRKEQATELISVLRHHPKLCAKTLASWESKPAVLEFHQDGQLKAIEYFSNLKNEGAPRLLNLNKRGGYQFDELKIFYTTDPLSALLIAHYKINNLKPEWNINNDERLWVIEKKGLSLRITKWTKASGPIVFKSFNKREVELKMRELLSQMALPKIVYRDPNDTEWKKERTEAHKLNINKLTSSHVNYPNQNFFMRFGEDSPCYFFENNRILGSRFLNSYQFNKFDSIPFKYKKIKETPQLRHKIIQLIQSEKNRVEKNLEIKLLRSEL
ncbi:MAG: hypothetical protein Fur0010_11200 [Bdellovibrio sp.]